MNRVALVIPWVLGVGLVGASLLGANRLLQSEVPAPGAADALRPPNAAPAAAAGRVTVLGSVASEPAEIPVGPPAVAAVVTVAKVFVADGQLVKPGDPLVQFDATLVIPKVEQARAELAAANQDIVRAEAQKRIHQVTLEAHEAAIRVAEAEIAQGEDLFNIARRQFEQILNVLNPRTRQAYTELEKQDERANNLELRKGESTLVIARAKLDQEKAKLTGLKLTPVDADLAAAQAKVNRLQATLAEAEAAVALHTLTARVGGIVEQIFATPGMTYGPATRLPVLHLVPTGQRIVRAEVEAEFIGRVSGSVGRKVLIADANNFALQYPGVVRLIGTAFLPKRGQIDGLTLNPVRVIECVIDIPDPSPPDKPPLRVGQPVRVVFP